MSFKTFGLAEPLVRAVTKQGYSTPTPIQTQAIPAVLSRRDVVGIAQTGTGKTAAFALPLLHQLHSAAEDRRSAGTRRTQVLVLASTRELALQIQESFDVYGAFAGVRVATIYGGVGQQPQVRALRSGVDIIVATPGRLLDLMKQGFVNLDGLKTLVLDEADRMLDMGFFPAIRRILERIPRNRQTLMFSATMKPEIRDLAASMLHDPIRITIEPKQKTTDLVEQSVCFVPQKQKTRVLIELISRACPSRAIVFSRTKHGADRIVRQMVAAGLRAEAIHANKSQNKRQRILDEFKSSSPPILVATDIAARGIDVDLVSHVFNHDMPTEEETYVHRIGRSGRAGATGIAVSLCDPEERRMLRSIEKLIGQTIEVDQLEGIELANLPAETADSRSEQNSRRPQRRRDSRSSDSTSGRDRARRSETGSGSGSSESGPRRFQGHAARRQEERVSRQRAESARASEERRSASNSEASGRSAVRPPRDAQQRDAQRRPAAQRNEEQRSERQRPAAQRPSTLRSEGQRSAGSRSEGQRSAGQRSDGPRSEGQRSSGQRSEGQRSSTQRPSTQRTSSHRTEGSRPAGQRSGGSQNRRRDDLTFGDGIFVEERPRNAAESQRPAERRRRPTKSRSSR